MYGARWGVTRDGTDGAPLTRERRGSSLGQVWRAGRAWAITGSMATSTGTRRDGAGLGRVAAMKAHPILRSDGSLHGFEMTSAGLMSGRRFRLLRSVEV